MNMPSLKNILVPIAVILVVALPLAASAIPLNDAQNIATNSNLSTETTAMGFLNKFLQAALAVAFLVAIVFVVISGYRMIVSAGNAEQLESAKRNLYWSIGGIVVIVLAWAMLVTVVNLVRSGQP
jgi:amino acid transporter